MTQLRESVAPSTAQDCESVAPSTAQGCESVAPSTAQGCESVAPSTTQGCESVAPSTAQGCESVAPSTAQGCESVAPSTAQGCESVAPTNGAGDPAAQLVEFTWLRPPYPRPGASNFIIYVFIFTVILLYTTGLSYRAGGQGCTGVQGFRGSGVGPSGLETEIMPERYQPPYVKQESREGGEGERTSPTFPLDSCPPVDRSTLSAGPTGATCSARPPPPCHCAVAPPACGQAGCPRWSTCAWSEAGSPAAPHTGGGKGGGGMPGQWPAPCSTTQGGERGGGRGLGGGGEGDK